MDNVTHTLFAVTLSRTPLGRAGRGTAAVLILASNAPDVDIVTTLGGASRYMTWHRGPTHGPLGVLGLGVATAALVWVGRRVVDAWRGRSPGGDEASFVRLASIGALGVLLHILMDLPTSYGTRLLSPLDWRWFTTDWMPIVDVYVLAALAAGLLFGVGSPEARHRNAAVVLTLMAANYGVRAVTHQQAVARAPRVFGPLLPRRCDEHAATEGTIEYWPRASTAVLAGPARCQLGIVAMPAFSSPFRWRLIAQLSNAYEVQDIDLLDARWREPSDSVEGGWRTATYVPNVWSPPVLAAASAPLFQRFLGFSRLPAVRVSLDAAGGAAVRGSDLRFAGPISFDATGPRSGLFTVAVQLAADGRIVAERLGP